LDGSDTDALPETAHAPVRADYRQTSRRTVLSSLGSSLALPLLPLSLLEGCTVTGPTNPDEQLVSSALQFTSPKLVPTIPQPIPTAVQAVTTATVGPSAGTIPDYFLGLSYEKGDFVSESLFTGANTSLAGLFNRLGNGVLSLGGNSLDKTLWTPEGCGNTAGQVSPVDVDDLAAFIALTNWKVLYGVNLGTSTPALAAAEVAYVKSKLGDVLIGFGIGNEPEEYSLSYFPSGWNLTVYEALWQQFRSAILSSTPSAVITGPASGGDVTTWTVPFALGHNGKLVSLLTQHYYRGNGHSVNATAANLVSKDLTIIADCVALKSAVSVRNIPFRFSETNSYLYGGSPGVSDAYASALWVIDHLFNIALGGGSGVNMQGGDVGSYTPIANCGFSVLEARPEYYGLLLFSLAGQGTLLRTALSNKEFNATIYTVVAASGAMSIVIVNKEVFQSLKITIDCGKTIYGADLIELRSTALTATTGQTLQGGTVDNDGSITQGAHYTPANISSSWVTFYVPAISAVLLRVF
jgi:hypothetical protein